MDTIKTKVDKVVIGPYDCDCAYVTVNKKPVQICFAKTDKIDQYEGKDITLTLASGVYKIVADIPVQKK